MAEHQHHQPLQVHLFLLRKAGEQISSLLSAAQAVSALFARQRIHLLLVLQLTIVEALLLARQKGEIWLPRSRRLLRFVKLELEIVTTSRRATMSGTDVKSLLYRYGMHCCHCEVTMLQITLEIDTIYSDLLYFKLFIDMQNLFRLEQRWIDHGHSRCRCP